MIPSTLFSTFSDVIFNDGDHSYINQLTNKKYTSVTTVIHEYETPFDDSVWLPIKAKEYNVSIDSVDYAWTFLNELSTYKGSAIHNFIEQYYFNKTHVYPQNEIISNFGYDPVFKDYEYIKKNQFLEFANISRNKLIPIKPEMIVYDNDYMISGMLDMIFYNVKKGMLEIWDWKTNKKLNTQNRFQNMKKVLSHLDQCEINTYSLQLHTYKHIIEKNTGIKFSDDCYIVWFFEGNKSYEIIKTKDMTYEVEIMIENFVSKKVS